MNDLVRTTITSMEAAEWCGKKHNELLKDIRRYIGQLGEGKIPHTDFFQETTYITEQNKTLPCFLVTKKGCEFIAHKMTGQKGTEFTARYINRFHEMEEGKLPCPLNPQIASSVAELGRVTERVMKNQGSAPYKIAEAFKMECEQFGIQLPADFVKVPEYEQMALSEFIKKATSTTSHTYNLPERGENMAMEQTTIQIGLRVNESMNDRLEKKASEIGVSKNSLILMLLDMGFKFMDGKFQIIPPTE